VRQVNLGLPQVPTFPPKNWANIRKKAHFNVFFLAESRSGHKLFRLLQCARIAEQKNGF
jgi:hypothetical protein